LTSSATSTPRALATSASPSPLVVWLSGSTPYGSPLRSRALDSRAEGMPDSREDESHAKSALQVVKRVSVTKPCSWPLAA